MEEKGFEPDSPEAQPPIRVVIAYGDLAAGKRAMQLLADVRKASGDATEFQLLLWSFDQLLDGDESDFAASDAVNADLLVLATSDINPLPLAIGRWAGTVVLRKRGMAAAVVALFGPEENPDAAGTPRLAALQAIVKQAGLDFFAPAPPQKLDETISRIHQRAERVTPLLNEILRQRRGSRRDQHTHAP